MGPRIDANSGTVLAVAYSVALGMNPQQALATLAVPVASLMIQTDVLARFTNTFFAHRIDAKLSKWTIKVFKETTYMAQFHGHCLERFQYF